MLPCHWDASRAVTQTPCLAMNPLESPSLQWTFEIASLMSAYSAHWPILGSGALHLNGVAHLPGWATGWAKEIDQV